MLLMMVLIHACLFLGGTSLPAASLRQRRRAIFLAVPTYSLVHPDPVRVCSKLPALSLALSSLDRNPISNNAGCASPHRFHHAHLSLRLFAVQMLAAATRLQDTAVSLFPVFLFFFIAFGGFIVRIPTLPGYLRSWAPTISFVRWAMEVCGCLWVLLIVY